MPGCGRVGEYAVQRDFRRHGADPAGTGEEEPAGESSGAPDLVKKVVDTVRTPGVRATAAQVFAGLDEPVRWVIPRRVRWWRPVGMRPGCSRGIAWRWWVLGTPTMRNSTSCRGTCARRSRRGVVRGRGFRACGPADRCLKRIRNCCGACRTEIAAWQFGTRGGGGRSHGGPP